jgi:branched-chain amino acid transport system substrate-binding protein
MLGRRTLAVGALLGALLPGLGAAQDKPVKIGVLTDMSGPFATLVGENSVEAARMAVEDAGGSIAGRKIEVVFGDTLNKADVAANLAQRPYRQAEQRRLRAVLRAVDARHQRPGPRHGAIDPGERW